MIVEGGKVERRIGDLSLLRYAARFADTLGKA